MVGTTGSLPLQIRHPKNYICWPGTVHSVGSSHRQAHELQQFLSAISLPFSMQMRVASFLHRQFATKAKTHQAMRKRFRLTGATLYYPTARLSAHAAAVVACRDRRAHAMRVRLTGWGTEQLATVLQQTGSLSTRSAATTIRQVVKIGSGTTGSATGAS